MGLAVVETSMCKCTMGDAPSTLLVSSQELVTIDGLLVATVADCIPMDNLIPFGTCTILTEAALGVPTPCIPAPAGMWEPGSIMQTINGLPVLLKTSMLMCSLGGEISVDESMNTIEETD